MSAIREQLKRQTNYSHSTRGTKNGFGSTAPCFLWQALSSSSHTRNTYAYQHRGDRLTQQQFTSLFSSGTARGSVVSRAFCSSRAFAQEDRRGVQICHERPKSNTRAVECRGFCRLHLPRSSRPSRRRAQLGARGVERRVQTHRPCNS